MKLLRLLTIAVVLTGSAVPLAASASTTYKFSIPVQLTAMKPGYYQFFCSVGGKAIAAQPGIPNPGWSPSFHITGTSYSGTVSAAPVVSATVAHTYDCVLYRINTGSMRNPMTGINQMISSYSLALVKFSGTM